MKKRERIQNIFIVVLYVLHSLGVAVVNVIRDFIRSTPKQRRNKIIGIVFMVLGVALMAAAVFHEELPLQRLSEWNPLLVLIAWGFPFGMVSLICGAVCFTEA